MAFGFLMHLKHKLLCGKFFIKRLPVFKFFFKHFEQRKFPVMKKMNNDFNGSHCQFYFLFVCRKKVAKLNLKLNKNKLTAHQN